MYEIEDCIEKIPRNFEIINKEVVDMDGFSIADEIPLVIESDILTESVIAFKTALSSTIEQLNSTIDFLKNELEEKNLHIRALLFRDANDGRSIDFELVEEKSENNIYVIETTSPVDKDVILCDKITSPLNNFQSPVKDKNALNTDIHETIINFNETANNERNNSLESSITDSMCTYASTDFSTNDESNYSTKECPLILNSDKSFVTIDNYDNRYDNKNNTQHSITSTPTQSNFNEYIETYPIDHAYDNTAFFTHQYSDSNNGWHDDDDVDVIKETRDHNDRWNAKVIHDNNYVHKWPGKTILVAGKDWGRNIMSRLEVFQVAQSTTCIIIYIHYCGKHPSHNFTSW